MKKRSAVKLLIFTSVTGVIVVLALVFNDINRHLRMTELGQFFRKSTVTDNCSDHMLLLSRFHIQRMMYENRMDDSAADLMELKINSLFAENSLKKEDAHYRMLIPATVPVINAMRYMMGKPPLLILAEEKQNRYLDMAYYYERNSRYDRAISLFADAQNAENTDREKIAGILLHKGFCFAVTGNKTESEKIFRTILAGYSNQKAAPTAAVLLHYIEGFNAETEKTLKEENSAGKAEKLFYLIAYNESLAVLKKIESQAGGEERARIAFFTGRCLESMGERDKAVETYQSIVMKYADTGYAKRANRRIFIAGSMLNPGSKLKELASKNNSLLHDPGFSALQTEEDKITSLKNDSANPDMVKEFQNIITTYDADASPEKADAKAAALIKTIDEKIASDAPPRAASLTEKIFTRNGNIFVGRVEKETADSITIITQLGTVHVMKPDIEKRQPGK